MRKNELQNLSANSKVMDKRNNTILEVIGLENGKYILSNGKCYSESTMYRWFAVVEVEQPVEEKTVEEKTVEDNVELHLPIKPTNTSKKVAVNENHEDHTGEADSKVVEANTKGKNNIDELFSQFNKVLDEHNAYFKPYKQYIGVLTPRKKGTLLQVRPNRQGNVNIDIKRGIWEKLKEQYRHLLEQQYGAKLYDKSRGYIRIFNMEDVNTFTILLLTALS
jgi:hypothetical protein